MAPGDDHVVDPGPRVLQVSHLSNDMERDLGHSAASPPAYLTHASPARRSYQRDRPTREPMKGVDHEQDSGCLRHHRGTDRQDR
jgi:hypothetical protein